MLLTKFHCHCPTGSGDDFFKVYTRFRPLVYTNMSVATMLVWRPRLFGHLFILPTPGGYIRNLVTIGPVVSEKTLLTEDDNGRPSLPTLKVPLEPLAQVS